MAVTSTQEGIAQPRFARRTVSLGAGDTSPWYPVAEYCTVSVSPGSGGTMLAQATWSPLSAVMNDNSRGTSTAVAHDWSPGTVSVNSNQYLMKATAVRFIATTAAGVGEIAS